MKKKGFTLIELLVVIAIIAMLLAILMPALNKVKRLAQRLVCATNLKGQGTAMMVYANDDKYEQYPNNNNRDGGSFTWDNFTADWQNPEKDWSAGGSLTNSSSLFLLVREADVDPKSFVCKSSDQKAYEGQAPLVSGETPELVELWDFGSPTYPAGESTGAINCVSYAFQNVFKVSTSPLLPARPASQTASAQFALMADRNPYWDKEAGTWSATPNADTWQGLCSYLSIADNAQKWEVQVANSFAHNREGQNVLYNDGHAEFAKRPDVGVENDNIYAPYTGPLTAPWSETDRRVGDPSSLTFTTGAIRDARDSYLVNDIEL